MLRVAITRTAPEADSTAARVRALGAEPVLAPLLRIAQRDFDPDVAGAQALLFSSANGVRAFATASKERGLAVLAVGDATRSAARLARFHDVRSADGDVGALAELALKTLAPTAGKLLHISGAHVAGDLTNTLAAAGYTVERRIGYMAEAVSALPPGFSRPLDIVLFHSARAAETFLRLGAPGAPALVAGCLSPKIAAAAGRTQWARLVVAPAPREDALLEATLRGQNAPAGAGA